jgi:integrase
MSVYKSKKSPYYWYDFECQGHRFFGSTKCESKREAEAVEGAERERAKREITAARGAETSLQLDDVALRYWNEVGQHHVGADSTYRDLGRLMDYFGSTKLLTEITDDDVAKLVAWRRGHRVKSRKDAPLIAAATVNRSTIEVLKKLFTRAKLWRVRFDFEPNWKDHFLKEPKEVERELQDDEADRLDDAMREDYAPLFAFVHMTGFRQKEAVLLKWSEVNWSTRQIVKTGKGGRRVVTQITDDVRDLLWPLQGHHPEAVFTYIVARTRGDKVRGLRLPLTLSGTKTMWRRRRKAAGVVGFRFHDFRHDFATKLLRDTGNLKLVSKALNHADIKTTMRYAHVLDEEIADAMQNLSQKSRKKSRTTIRKLG